jgi:hypothetical protein
MYGVIIVMTFTSTLRSASLDTQEVYSTIVFAALFSCIAWGLADGVFYAWEDVYNARTRNTMIEDSKSENTKSLADSMIEEELDDTIIGTIEEADRKKVYENIRKYLARPSVKKTKKSFLKTLPPYLLGTSLLSVGSGILVLSPFFVFQNNVRLALNISNILGIVTLFAIGFFRTPEDRIYQKIASGVISAILGGIIALTTIALGG